MKILYGCVPLTPWSIRLHGRPAELASPLFHQHQPPCWATGLPPVYRRRPSLSVCWSSSLEWSAAWGDICAVHGRLPQTFEGPSVYSVIPGHTADPTNWSNLLYHVYEHEYQLSGWIIIINGDGGCSFWQPVQTDSQPKSSGLVLGRRQLGAVLHSPNEPGEPSQWLCHDDSTIKIVVIIIIIIITSISGPRCIFT